MGCIRLRVDYTLTCPLLLLALDPGAPSLPEARQVANCLFAVSCDGRFDLQTLGGDIDSLSLSFLLAELAILGGYFNFVSPVSIIRQIRSAHMIMDLRQRRFSLNLRRFMHMHTVDCVGLDVLMQDFLAAWTYYKGRGENLFNARMRLQKVSVLPLVAVGARDGR